MYASIPVDYRQAIDTFGAFSLDNKTARRLYCALI